MRVLPRKVEGAIGLKLLKLGGRKLLQDSGLVLKSINVDVASDSETVTTTTTKVNYYERDGIEPTILFCHGLSDEAKNMAGFITALDLPNRILVPDAVGHGTDLEHAFNDSFIHPTPAVFVHTTEALLKTLGVTKCHAFGYSMGGALVYFLKCRRPDLVLKTVLLSPSIEQVVDPKFLENFTERKHNYFCFESRCDVKILMRTMSVPDAQKKDPIPKFFLQGILDHRNKTAPPDHFRKMMEALLEGRGEMEMYSCKKDIRPDTEQRLVIWPDQDALCNYELGKAFFAESRGTEFVTVAIRWLHSFASTLPTIPAS